MKVPWRKRVSRHLRARLRARVLAGYGIGVVADTRNGTLVVHARDFSVSRTLLEQGHYDWPQITLLQTLVTPGARIVVVGAHIGSLLIPIARSCGATSVVAFEPSPRNRRLLAMNLLLNGLTGVVVHPCAAGAAPGTARFTENVINSGSSRVRAGGEIEVAVVTLNDTIPRDWSSIDLLIIDAEGFEVSILRGASTVLPKTRAAYVEYAPEDLEEQGCTIAQFADLLSATFGVVYAVRGERVQQIAGRLADYLAAYSAHGRSFDLLCTHEPLPGR